MTLKLQAIWARVPDQVKLAVRDALEAGLAAAAGLAIALPTSLDDAKREALVVVVAVGAAVIAVLRRELLPWILAKAFGGAGA